MLKYLIQITQDMFVPCVIAALLYAYITLVDKKGRLALNVGAAVTFVFSLIMAYFRQTTNKVNTEAWNVRFIAISLIALIVFYVFSGIFVRKLMKKAGGYIACISAAVLLFGIFMEVLPTAMLYPFGFVQADESIFSTDFIFKSMGFVFGVILMIVMGLAAYRGSDASGDRVKTVVLKAVLLANGIRQLGRLLSLLKVRVRSGYIKGPAAAALTSITGTKSARAFTQFVSNKSFAFIYIAILILLAVPLIMWARSFKVNEPYDNPAQHRRIRAKWRSRRRWASTAMICCLLSVLNLTVVKAYNEKGAEITPAEDCEIRDNCMYVSLEQVSDGHLHRFAYITQAGVDIRFIVIKKPNSSSYGIGLDACDICGKTGYYEKNDKVVCSRCDVVMNINTIGFKGGCNPIPIEYKVENGYIIVPVDVLLEYEKEFK